MTDKTTWRKLIGDALKENSEGWDDVVSITLSSEQLDIEFDSGFGGSQGQPFTAWTDNSVYFPVTYDGAEWCGRVPRNPNGEATRHLGGQ